DWRDHLVEQLPRAPNKRETRAVFVASRRFADQHDAGLRVAIREHGVRGVLLQRAAIEGFQCRAQLVECVALRGNVERRTDLVGVRAGGRRLVLMGEGPTFARMRRGGDGNRLGSGRFARCSCASGGGGPLHETIHRLVQHGLVRPGFDEPGKIGQRVGAVGWEHGGNHRAEPGNVRPYPIDALVSCPHKAPSGMASESVMADAVERESMEYDVVIVGAGPAGLAAAIRLKQQAAKKGHEISVCVLEKGSEVGAHILSGAVIDPIGISELFPNWKELGAPLDTPVTSDQFWFLGPAGSVRFPKIMFPPLVCSHGNYIASLTNLTKWMARQGEGLGVEIYPGSPAADIVFGENGEVKGVTTGDLGVAKDGHHKSDFTPGMNLLGKYTLFAEGARGSLSKRLGAHYKLHEGRDPQKFGIGLKELWELPKDKHKPGLVMHTMGWPLDNSTGGGVFMYHWGENFCSIGFVVHLNYSNPFISPFDEFQRVKHHPRIKQYLEGGKRIGYGARAITEGGLQSVPKLVFPGGALIGCSAGFVNVPRIKGSHNAIATGIMAADAAFDAVKLGRSGDLLDAYEVAYQHSHVYKDLKRVRNVKPLWSKLGTVLGVAVGGVDMWFNQLFGFSPLGTLKHGKADYQTL